jgi:hypothetical protein
VPLIKDLIAIPERVHQGDFVLPLMKGAMQPEQTLRDYVVRPQFVDAFGTELSLKSSSSAIAADFDVAAMVSPPLGSSYSPRSPSRHPKTRRRRLSHLEAIPPRTP